MASSAANWAVSPRTVADYLIPLAILIAGGLLTWLTCSRMAILVEAERQVTFHAACDRLTSELERRFHVPVYGLRGAQGAILAGGARDAAEFRAYVAARDLDRAFPGILGFGFIRRCQRLDLDALVAEERADQGPAFTVRTSGTAADLYIITRIEPLSRNRPAWGFDVGSESERRNAVERAVATGSPTITGIITLVQDGERTPGFLILLPVYTPGLPLDSPEQRTAALHGLVYAPLIARDLLHGIESLSGGVVTCRVTDGPAATAPTIYHTSTPAAIDPAHTSVREASIHGRDLGMHLMGTPALYATSAPAGIRAIAVAGALLSLCMALCVHLLLVGQRRALGLAERMTTALSLAKERAEDLARESATFQAAIDRHTIVSITDAQGRITAANDAFCAISGYERHELVGQDHQIVKSGVHEREFWRRAWDELVAGRPWRADVCNRAKDGSLYWVDSLIVPFLDSDGRPERFISIRTDISARKHSEAGQHAAIVLREAILTATHHAVIAVRIDGIISHFNPAAERMLGYGAHEMIGLHTPALFHDPAEMSARAAVLSAELGRTVELGLDVFVVLPRERGGADEREWTYVRKDGSRFPVLLSVTAIRDAEGVLQGYLGVALDISERRRQDERLRAALAAAEAATRAKADFLATMSHEIRTPMNGVIGMTGQLLKTDLDPHQRDCAETIRSCGESLLTLISDILDFSKIEAGRLELEAIPVDLVQLTHEVIALFLPTAEAKSISLSSELAADLPRSLSCDPTRIRQILTNLISNALKFTEQGGVVLRLSCPGPIVIEVADTGIGMTVDQRQRIGEAFAQADASTTRQYGGTGLGLSICTRLVELMHGRFELTSHLGQGTTVRIELPLAAATEAPRAATPAPIHARLALGRVLLTEDNLVNRKVIQLMLRAHVEAIEVAVNGAEAVAMAAGGGYHCILMDCQMPVMDGYEATRHIRAQELADARPRTPIIALTANALSSDRERCLAAGMDAYVSKPLREEDLMTALARLPPTPSGQLDHLRAIMSPAEIDQLVTESIGVLTSIVDQLDQVVRDRDWLRLARLAHDLRGTAVYLNLEALGALASSVERAGRNADATTCTASAPVLSSATHAAIAILARARTA